MENETLTTAQVAELFHIKENTVRRRLCLDGDFYGIKPIKVPSRRLLWSRDRVMVLLSGVKTK